MKYTVAVKESYGAMIIHARDLTLDDALKLDAKLRATYDPIETTRWVKIIEQ
jgi:hypothetical protein